MFWTELPSPLGELTLSAENEAMTGLWISTSPQCPVFPATAYQPKLSLFQETQHWLDVYFSGRDAGRLPPLSPKGSAFSLAVWSLLREIPYGKTRTYGELSRALQTRGISSSPQAIGGAVGRNPILILIPCHRVIGADGSLTGYSGGLEAKRTLLRLEGITCPTHRPGGK